MDTHEQARSGGEARPRILFERRAAMMPRLTGAACVEDIVSLLRVDRRVHLHRTVAEAATAHATSFFACGHPADVLRETILPRLIRRNAASRRLRLWSGASSTGQEAYSLAMLIRQHFPGIARWDVQILGSDLSLESIAYARRGLYRMSEVVSLPQSLREKYLVREGEDWRVLPEIRGMCHFETSDLRIAPPSAPAFDLILLRDVLLYLSPQECRKVLGHVHGRLAATGYLLLGDAEQAEDSTSLFRSEPANGSCFYHRAEEDDAAGDG